MTNYERFKLGFQEGGEKGGQTVGGASTETDESSPLEPQLSLKSFFTMLLKLEWQLDGEANAIKQVLPSQPPLQLASSPLEMAIGTISQLRTRVFKSRVWEEEEEEEGVRW
ncbi:hypothetical protein LOK49_LG05G01319 [Camellia lanceoleosa]|uniref:Uncharacterized protein n=1 Tax=Camellia lanceoleosa TaxID=1840588 RepID=A0ACC0HSW1_9ERIC|nr:hypothetical protein LOK49_LG05G01319 [Camellia lanceoleosa]